MRNKIVHAFLFLLCSIFLSFYVYPEFTTLLYGSLGEKYPLLYSIVFPPISFGYCVGPAIAALLFIAVIKGDRFRWVSIKPFNVLSVLFVLLLPFIIRGLALLVQLPLGLVTYRPTDPQVSVYGILLSGALFFIASFVFNSIYSGLGEEIGWRGYLHNKLKGVSWPYFVIIINVIWILWHFPLFVKGFHGSVSLIGFTLFSIRLFLVGIILIYLRLASNSVIPCAMFHGGMNVTLSIFFSYFTVNNKILAGPDNIIQICLFLPVAIYFYRKGYQLYINDRSN